MFLRPVSYYPINLAENRCSHTQVRCLPVLKGSLTVSKYLCKTKSGTIFLLFKIKVSDVKIPSPIYHRRWYHSSIRFSKINYDDFAFSVSLWLSRIKTFPCSKYSSFCSIDKERKIRSNSSSSRVAVFPE